MVLALGCAHVQLGVLLTPYLKQWGKHPAIKAIVDGITAAAIGAIAGAVLVLAKRQLTGLVSLGATVATNILLLRFKKITRAICHCYCRVIGIDLESQVEKLN